jgi:carbon-monoxide dehydrogenase medium subunit
MKNFQYILAANLDEALTLMEEFGGKNALIMAGGTDLLVRLKDGEIKPDCIIDLKGISGLAYIECEDNRGLKIGALSSIADVEKSPMLSSEYTALAEAASSIGSVQIRNKGTIGGNLCNASPSADMAPPLIVMGAKVRIVGKTGERISNLEDFFLGPGRTVLRNGEILTEIEVPKPPPLSGAAYIKLSRRDGMDLAIAGVACLLVINSESRCERARITMGAVAPIPLRAKEAEALMIGEKIGGELIEEVAKRAAEEGKPISDVRATANYRREIIEVLVDRAIRESMRRIESRAYE